MTSHLRGPFRLGNDKVLDALRLFPKWVIAPSVGAGIPYFLMQVGWLGWYAYGQCSATDDSGVQGCIWYVCKQVPPTLPLAGVFAVGLMVFAQVLGRFAEFMTLPHDVSTWGVQYRARTILFLCLIAFVVLSFTILSDDVPVLLTLAVVAYICSQPWVVWINRMVGSDRNGTNSTEEERA